MTDWDAIVDCLFDFGQVGDFHPTPLPGMNWGEVVALTEHDFDDVDRMLIDYETMGG